MFHRSILDNIRIGRPEAAEADVYAARMAMQPSSSKRYQYHRTLSENAV